MTAPTESAQPLESKAPELTPEPTSEPTPEPTQEPTPEPTPIPLRQPDLCDTIIDQDLFFVPATQQGTVERVPYVTRDYITGTATEYEKTLSVYLPYGYDGTEAYDVLFLLHTSGANEKFWLESEHSYQVPDGELWYVWLTNLLDNMIQQGYCKPMIVVAPWGYLDEYGPVQHNSARDYGTFTIEFRRDILPLVAERYHTFAADGSEQALIAAREHFGVLGASYGAYMAEISIMAPSLDLVSWYALVGGGSVSREYLEPEWSRNGLSQYPVSLLYFIEGTYDDRQPVELSYMNLGWWEERFTPEENLRLTMVERCAHEERAWINGLYNAAQLFFR